MNWRDILKFDLGRLIPGYRPPPAAESRSRPPWFLRPFVARNRRRAASEMKLEDPDYRPGLYYRGITRRWRGPGYMNASHWREDLLRVTEQIRAIVRANAPLVRGLETAAREEKRLSTKMGRRGFRFMGPALAVGLSVATGLLVATIPLLEEGDVNAVLVLFADLAIAVLLATLMLSRGGRTEAVFLRLRDHVASGNSLSEAMRRLPRFFPRLHADLVKAGEDSGRLSDCLNQLNEDTVRNITLGRQIMVNFGYLFTVLTIQTLLISFLLAKVAPVLVEIMSEMSVQEETVETSSAMAQRYDRDDDGEEPVAAEAGRAPLALARAAKKPPAGKAALNPAIPAELRWGIAISDYIVDPNHGGRMLRRVGLGLLILAAYLLYRRGRDRRNASSRLMATPWLWVPWLRGLFIKQNLVAIGTMLDKMLRAGVPLDEALENVAAADLHPIYRAALRRARARVLEGETLAAAFDAAAKFAPVPRAFRGFIGLGEESGMLPDALARVTQFYRRDVEKRLYILSDTIVPVGVVMLGCLTLIAELALFKSMIALVDVLAMPI